jgi:hypothetical protein
MIQIRERFVIILYPLICWELQNLDFFEEKFEKKELLRFWRDASTIKQNC